MGNVMGVKLTPRGERVLALFALVVFFGAFMLAGWIEGMA